MFYTIYKITNKIDGKYYIGKHQTKDLFDGYFGSGRLIQRAIKKHGKDNFLKEILHVFDNELEMNQKEKELVQIEDRSYNLCEGGQGGWSYVNRIRTPEQQYKLSQMGGLKGGLRNRELKIGICDPKNRVISEAFKLAGKTSFLGKKHSKETKKKIAENSSKCQKGKKNSQYGTCWIKHPQFGNKKIDKDDLSMYINEGWMRGRVYEERGENPSKL